MRIPCRLSSIERSILTFILLTLSFALTTESSIARSLDPGGCPTDTRRVKFAGLIFCWPSDDTAPRFSFEIQGMFLGSQYWLGRAPVSGRKVAEREDGQDRRRRPVFATFRIVPFDHPVLRIDWRLAAAYQIKKAIEGRGDSSEVAVSLFISEKFGRQELRFQEVESGLFGAALATKELAGPRELEFLVPLNRYGTTDYVLSCTEGEHFRICSSHFLLAENVVSVTMNFVEDVDQARRIFEAMRAQIRSYVLLPKPNRL